MLRRVKASSLSPACKHRKQGTFVAAPKIHFNKLMSYTEQMGSRSLNACSRVLLAKIIDDEQDVNARLALTPKSKVVKIERLRHAGDEPFALETCYLSGAQFSGLISAATTARIVVRHAGA